MEKKYLITTNLDKDFVVKSKGVYLGDWCLDSKEVRINKTIKSINLNKHSPYLKKITARLANSMAEYLMKNTKEKLSKKFWQNLIWVWLSYYISSNYYRWKRIEQITTKQKFNIIDFNLNKHFYFNDVNTYTDLISNSDLFNYINITNILKHFKKKVIKINKNIVFSNLKRNNYIKPRFILKDFIFNLYTFCFSIFLNKNKIFLSTVFSLKNLIKLNFRLKQLPQFLNSYFTNKSYYLILEKKLKRTKKNFNFRPKNSFELFLKNNIIDDIPLTYIENFEKNLKEIKKLKISPKVILCSGEHYHNEKFKIWSLYRKEFFNTKLLVVDHGGNHQIDDHQFNYDKKFSDNFISWIKDKKKRKPYNPKIFFNFVKKQKKTKIIYVGYERPKYPSKLSSTHVYGINDLNTYQNLKILKKNLEIDKDKIFYSPKNIIDERLKTNITKVLGEKNILENNSFVKNIKHSKYVICEYPMTAYLESLLITPTFLVCDIEKVFIPIKNFKNIYSMLEKHNLLFSNMKKFTNFMNKNNKNIDDFWDQNKIKILRKRIMDKFSVDSLENLIGSWESYLKRYN